MRYAHSERTYEYWYGEAVPKASGTWTHGVSQAIIGTLLMKQGYKAGSEVELRIDPSAYPNPDVIATKGAVETPYPTKAVEVVVEVLSKDDPMPYLLQKRRAYESWGFPFIYVVDPESRTLFRWTGQAMGVADPLTSIPAAAIWAELDKALKS